MIEQILIGLFGVTAVWLSQQSNNNLKRYACILGLCSRPFWFYATYKAQQWGIFGLSFIYTYSWATGFYNNWIIYNKEAN